MASGTTDLDFLWTYWIEDECGLDERESYIPSEVWTDWKVAERYAEGDSRFWCLSPNTKTRFKEDASRHISNARGFVVDWCKSELDISRATVKRILSLASMRALPLSGGASQLPERYEVDKIYSNVLHILIPYFANLDLEESLHLLTVLRDPLFENQPVTLPVALIDDWRLQTACVRLLLFGQPSLDFCINLFKQFFSSLLSLDEKLHLIKRICSYLLYNEPYRIFAMEVFATLCQKGLHPSLITMIMQVLRDVDDENAVTVLYPVLYSYARTFKYPIIYQRDEDHPAYGTIEGPDAANARLDDARPYTSADYCSVRTMDAEDASLEFNLLVDYYHRSRPPVHSCEKGDQCRRAPERLRWDIRGKEPYKCFVCRAPASTACSRCGVIRFCSTACQSEAWTAEMGHKHFCRVISDARLGELRYVLT